jgi:hypothetical protein
MGVVFRSRQTKILVEFKSGNNILRTVKGYTGLNKAKNECFRKELNIYSVNKKGVKTILGVT